MIGTQKFANAVPLADAIERARKNLLHLQHPDGHWRGELFADSTLVSDYLAYLHWSALSPGAEKVDAVLQEKCIAHIRRRQLPDGGWAIYEDGPSEINATIKAYLALKLAGHPPTQPWMQEARAAALRLGGIPRMNTYSKLYLALLGQFPWEQLPTVPPEMILFPKWFPFHLCEMSSWSRAMLVPLTLVNHKRPTRALPPEKALHELYPAGTERTDLRPQWRRPRLSWPNFFLACDRMLKALHLLPWKPFRALAVRRCEAWMLERMGEGSDGLAAIFPAMLNAMIALETLGYSTSHPAMVKARRDFDGLLVDDPRDFRIQPCLSPVWDTAIATIALAESELAPPTTHPAIARAQAWLAAREVRSHGDWAIKNPHPEPSGWAFEYRNDFYPDTDDTMMVLLALRGAEPQPRALAWLLSFQCRDGGWAAFDRDVTQRWLQDVPFADHNAILDPSCADLTGRALELMGKIGHPLDDARVRRALAFLRRTQEPDGSWIGRWGVNYIYGTWQVLRGLHSIGEDTRQDWIVRARDWLESCQNEDGGWGETCASYEDSRLKGKGPSTPSQTAWALMGLFSALLPAEHAARKSIRRGIAWLLEQQSADGSWPEHATTGTGFPRVFYLKYDLYRNTWPLIALSEYRRAIAGRAPFAY